MVISIFDNSIDIINRLKELVAEAEQVSSIQYATNYPDALEMVKSIKPDIILLDINFHNKNPYDLLKHIKTQFSLTIVIVLSIHIDEKIQSQCDMLGADYFFDKYYEFDKIPGVLNSIAASKKSSI